MTRVLKIEKWVLRYFVEGEECGTLHKFITDSEREADRFVSMMGNGIEVFSSKPEYVDLSEI